MTSIDGYAHWMETDLPHDAVIPARYWPDNAHWVFDPWAKREGAKNIHSHRHTAWAKRIFENWFNGPHISPANFDWSGETIFIVGRGESLVDAVPALNGISHRRIWLNSAFLLPGVEMGPDDYVMAFDAAISTDVAMKGAAKKTKLITAPIMDPKVFKWGWKSIHGFTFWNDAPLNEFMRGLFSLLPELVECLGVNVTALHLAAKCGAKKIVLVGQDCVSTIDVQGHGLLRYKLPNGQTAASDLYYSQLAMACSMMAFFAYKRTGVEIVNCSGTPLIGHDLMSTRCEPFPWMKCDSLENHIGV